MTEKRKVLNRTHFERREGKRGWQWYWRTIANNGRSVAVGGEGYDELRSAVHGFFATHGIDSETTWDETSKFTLPERFKDNHYVVTQFDN